MGRVRVGVVGAGWFARLAAIPALQGHPDAELVAVCDTDPARVADTVTEFGVPHGFSSVEELVSAGVADAVVVAVSQTAHHTVCRAALRAGLHVLVEKPMVLTAEHAWELVDLAGDRGLVLMVGETYHFPSVSQQVRDIVRSGRLGRLLQIAGTFNSHTARLFAGGSALPDGRGGSYADVALAGGGQGHTQVSHLAGLALWTTGEAVTEVFAYLDNVGLQVDLVDAIVARLAGGGSLALSALGTMPSGHPARDRVEYYGTDGVIVHDLIAGRATLALPDEPEQVLTLGEDETTYPLEGPARQFVELIKGTATTNDAPGDTAARCVELLDAAYRSAATGAPVTVAPRAAASPGS